MHADIASREIAQATTRMPILMYHSLDDSGSVVSMAPRAFQEQVACIHDLGLQGLSLRGAVSHRVATGEWPPRSVVLTFDDGFANFIDCALPVLDRYGFTATVFIVTGHMGGWNAWGAPSRLGRQPILTWDQAREAAAAGMEIGSHTQTHLNLSLVSLDRADEEISVSRSEIEDRLGLSVTSFAYPFGATSEAIIDIVKREFDAACTTVLKRASDEPLHALPRVDMYYMKSLERFVLLLRGEMDHYLTIRRLGRGARKMFA